MKKTLIWISSKKKDFYKWTHLTVVAPHKSSITRVWTKHQDSEKGLSQTAVYQQLLEYWKKVASKAGESDEKYRRNSWIKKAVFNCKQQQIQDKAIFNLLFGKDLPRN